MTSNFSHPDQFISRHIGPDEAEVAEMLRVIGAPSLDALIDQTVPSGIRARQPLSIPAPASESDLLAELQSISAQNQLFRSYVGMGYSDCITPPVVLRNILENPGWYTAYTPYQAEIAQGRLEALLNYQQMVKDLTGMQIANASLLDEATAAAEAMHMVFALADDDNGPSAFLVSDQCHPQTIDVVCTRAEPTGVEIIVADVGKWDWKQKVAGVLLQYPTTDGAVVDRRAFVE